MQTDALGVMSERDDREFERRMSGRIELFELLLKIPA